MADSFYFGRVPTAEEVAAYMSEEVVNDLPSDTVMIASMWKTAQARREENTAWAVIAPAVDHLCSVHFANQTVDYDDLGGLLDVGTFICYAIIEQCRWTCDGPGGRWYEELEAMPGTRGDDVFRAWSDFFWNGPFEAFVQESTPGVSIMDWSQVARRMEDPSYDDHEPVREYMRAMIVQEILEGATRQATIHLN